MPSTPGWRAYCYSSSKRKWKDLFYKLFLMNPLSIQSPTFAWRLCQCYLEACLWYSDFWQEHLKPNAKCFLAQLSKHRCMGIVMKFLSPYLNGFKILFCHGYHALLVLGKDIPLKYVFKHIFLSILLFNQIIIISFRLFGLTYLLIYMI